MAEQSPEITLKNLPTYIKQGFAFREAQEFEKALLIAKQCLQQFPMNADVHFLQGLLHLDKSHFFEAEKSLNIAISIQPQREDFYIFLGQVLKMEHRYYEAEATLNQCLKLNKENFSALLLLGSLYEEQKRIREAKKVLQQALLLKPDSAKVYYHLGVINHRLGKLPEAIVLYEKALALSPNDIGILSNLGAVYTMDRQYQKAIHCYQKTLKLQPKYMPAITNLGGTYIEMKAFNKAEKMMRQALEISPNMSANWRNLTLCVKYHSLDNPDFTTISKLLDNPKINTEDKIHLNFAIGKIYHDCKKYDEAFSCFKIANDLHSKIVIFNSKNFASHVSQVIKYFDKSVLKKIKLKHEKHEKQVSPLIIVGTSRSGKSLLEDLLTQLPQIYAGGEIGIAEYGARISIEEQPKGNYPYWLKSLTKAQAQALQNVYLNRLMRDATEDTMYVMDTLPGNFLYLGLLLSLFPDAKIIYCRRNPLDACLLMYFKYYVQGHGYTNQLQTLGEYCQQFQRLMGHWGELIGSAIYEVNYEELVSAPQDVLQKIMKFLKMSKKKKFDIHDVHTDEVGVWRNYEKYLDPLITSLNTPMPVEEKNEKVTQISEMMGSAYQQFDVGELKIVEMLCQTILEMDPNHYPAIHLLGMVHYQQDEFAQALSQYEAALKIAPNVIQLHIDAAKTLKAMNQHMRAEQYNRRAEALQLQRDKGQRINLDQVQRQELLSAFLKIPDIKDEFETRLLIQGQIGENFTTDSYMTRSWDQYFTDLSYGSYRNIEIGGKHTWRMRAWHFAYKNIALVERILKHPQEKIRILDIGCSSGYFRRFLEGNLSPKEPKKIYYWGLDIREEVLENAVKGIDDIESGAKGNLVPAAFIIHDISHGLPYQDNFFDYVINFEMIKYLPIHLGKKLMAEMYRVLNVKGELVLSSMYSSNQPGFMQSVPFEQLEQILQQNGFQIIERRGSQANIRGLMSRFKEDHIPLIKELLLVHPPEMVAAMITPLYPFCSEQVTFYCKIKE